MRRTILCGDEVLKEWNTERYTTAPITTTAAADAMSQLTATGQQATQDVAACT